MQETLKGKYKKPIQGQHFKRFLFLVPTKADKEIPIGYRLCRRAGVAGDNTCNGASGETSARDNTNKGGV